MEADKPTFASEIRRLRLERGLSLREAAGRIDVSFSRLAEWERGEDSHSGRLVVPGFDVVRRLARLYGAPPDTLLRLAGYGPEPELPEDERRLLAAYRRLPTERRASLVTEVEAEAGEGG